MRTPPGTIGKVRRAYLRGMSIREISTQTNLSYGAVRRWLIQSETPLRGKGGKGSRLDENLSREARELYSHGVRIPEIARRLDLDRHTARYHAALRKRTAYDTETA